MLGIRSYLIGAAAAVAVVVAVMVYGQVKYDKGYDQAIADVKAKSQAETQKAQADKDDAEKKYREAVKEREDVQRTADTHIARLNRLLDSKSGNPKSTITASGADGAGETRLLVLKECVREYTAMGEHAGRLADKVNGWHDYGTILQRWGN